MLISLEKSQYISNGLIPPLAWIDEVVLSDYDSFCSLQLSLKTATRNLIIVIGVAALFRALLLQKRGLGNQFEIESSLVNLTRGVRMLIAKTSLAHSLQEQRFPQIKG